MADIDEDLIVVDDIDDNDAFQPSHRAASSHAPQRSLPPRASRLAANRRQSTPPYIDPSEGRTTRSAARGPKIQPKLKLKLSEKAAAQAPGMSFLGPYDRELDSDDEDLVFEEQFILRMPPGEDCERLRKMVQAREISDDVWFKFKDSRRAVFHIGNNTYSSKLVDLPCIIESQKTLDNKQMFKVADICQVRSALSYLLASPNVLLQMLLVEDKIPNEESLSSRGGFNIDEFIYPHGITPPLKHVRKRRFRKRVNRRTIETVEQEVERLLEADAMASEVKYDVLENVNPDLSDSEFINIEVNDDEHGLDAPTPGFDAPTPAADAGAEEDEDEGAGAAGRDEEEEAEGDIDEELAAELDLALGDDEGGAEADEDEEEEDEEEEDESDEDDDDDDEAVQARKLLNEEIRDLEAAVYKKQTEIASSANPLIKRRFEDALKKLQADLDTKMAQRDEMKEQSRLRKEGITSGGATAGGNDSGAEDDDLFGEGPDGMEIG
ncbi:TAFII55 protein conserved region-domain-containing protein [Cerioporus squamosus]|nr:TAFII55 protein conserved region-domain-containing protein [Cerioporus squamosus]